MTKTELKNGAVVELRNGTRYLKVDNTLLDLNFIGNYMPLDVYTEDLRNAEPASYNNKDWDIMKVNNNVTNSNGHLNNAICEITINKWTWERPEPILDEVEKDYLSKICKPFKVISVVKHRIENVEYIKINIDSNLSPVDWADYIVMPYFKPNTMYKGMKLYKEYTPEELEL